jgi:hypothetical protein
MSEPFLQKNPTHLDHVMTLLGVSARYLSAQSYITNSIISRWQKGTRALTARSGAVSALADALLSADTKGQLEELLSPYRASGESMKNALIHYLTTDGLAAMPARAALPEIVRSGEYVAQQRVLLGETGFRKAVLLMLDYVMILPPGRQIVACAHEGFELFLHNIPFALQFIQKMSAAIKRGTSFLLINRRGFGMENDAHFARFWLVAHLKGIIRSRYYDGDPPKEYFVGSIRGYWGGEAETDPTAEDNLVSVVYTDPRNTRKAEAHCEAFMQRSTPASQYRFLKSPEGDAENIQYWRPGPLPKWKGPDAKAPAGCFSAIMRVPSIGVMTKAEFESVLAKDGPPAMPDYLFRDDGSFVPGEHKIMLCREDVREGLSKERVQNEPLSALLHRRVFLSRGMLTDMLKRLLGAMEQYEQFYVALLPKSAFVKLELELVCWKNSASVGWLQDGAESVFANDPITSGSFHVAIDHAWDRLHKGWKRKTLVMRTLRKWLAGKELDIQEQDSAIVRNWDILPKE